MSERVPPYTDSNGRVPLTGALGHHHILQEYPTWIVQQMATGVAHDGTEPETATTTPEETVPEVSAAFARYADLTHGGLFVLPGKYLRSVEVLAVDNEAAATLTIVNPVESTTRSAPATCPYVLAPGEYFKATGGTTGKRVGIQVQEYMPYK